MSIHLSSRVWEIEGLAPAAKLVLLKLADNANDAGICWPAIGTICRETGCGRTTVQRHVADFESRGWLIRQQRKDSSNIFTLTLPAREAEQGGPKMGRGPKTGQGGPQNGAGGAPQWGTEPSVEPSKEPLRYIEGNSKKISSQKTAKPKAPKAPEICEIILAQLGDEHRKHATFSLRLGEYVQHRFAAGKKMTAEAGRRLGLKLAKHLPDTCAEAVEISLERGWAGIFPDSVKKPQTGKGMSGKGHVQMLGEGASDEEMKDLF